MDSVTNSHELKVDNYTSRGATLSKYFAFFFLKRGLSKRKEFAPLGANSFLLGQSLFRSSLASSRKHPI